MGILSCGEVDIIAASGDPRSGLFGTASRGSLYLRTDTGQSHVSTGSGQVEWTDPVVTSGTSEYFDGYDSAGGTDISAGWANIPFGTERKKTAEFLHAAGSAEVTIVGSGTYDTTYSCTTDVTSGSARSSSECRLMLDQGFGYIQVPGSIGRIYNRNSSQGEGTATRRLVLELNSGDKIKMQARRLSGTSNVATLAGASSLTISRNSGVGQQGAQGAAGPPGSGSSIIVQSGGSPIAGTPHTALNFTGGNVSASDAGSGVADITVTPVFGKDYQYVEDEAESTTTSSVPQVKVSLVTPALTGTYLVSWTAQMRNLTSGQRYGIGLHNVTDNDWIDFEEGTQQNANNEYQTSGFAEVVFTGTSKNLSIKYRAVGGGTASISRARVAIWRVS